MNKFQEALDRLDRQTQTLSSKDSSIIIHQQEIETLQELINDYETLQELINDYEKLKKAFDMACHDLAKSETFRLVLLGGNAKDYEEYYLKSELYLTPNYMFRQSETLRGEKE